MIQRRESPGPKERRRFCAGGGAGRDQLAESLAAVSARLSADEWAQLEKAIPRDAVAGTRYGRSR
jgi:hypothetical protein